MQVTPKIKLLRHTDRPEETIALAAKLCYSELDIDGLLGKVEAGDNAKFIRLLLSLGHMSPIEHASFTFSLEGVSRALLAQITRHRIASFSVKSQRYVGATDFNYIIPPAITAKGEEYVNKFESQMKQIEGWYSEWQQILGGNKESSNEDARFVLPNACETKMILTMNARELMHFFNLRCCNRAQWEIREAAWQMLSEVLQVAPSLFENSGPACVAGACSEGKMSCGKAAEIREKQNALRLWDKAMRVVKEMKENNKDGGVVMKPFDKQERP